MNHQASPPAEWSMTDQEFDQLRRAIFDFSGIVIGPEKRSLIRARLQRRILALQLGSLAEYLKLIGKTAGSVEREQFISSLTTNVTSFFREQHHFDLITGTIFPAWKDVGQKLQIWSAGCSSGQEPYSIAMSIHDKTPDLASRTKITATDIDLTILARAKSGIYKRKDLVGVPPTMVSRYFRAAKAPGQADDLQLIPTLCGMVDFQQLNLNSHWTMPQKFDVILCRNVAIYFNQDTQLQLWRKFLKVLQPGGWLLIGHSERVPAELHSLLQPSGITAYQKAH